MRGTHTHTNTELQKRGRKFIIGIKLSLKVS